jgi:beta-galactosidase
MKKLLVLLITLAAIGGRGFAQDGRERRNFDDGWKFHLGNASDPAKDFNYGVGNILAKTGDADNTCIKAKYDDAGWADVQLPHDWAVGLPFVHSANDDVDAHGYHAIGGLFPQNSIGWYRKTFTVEKSDSGRRFVLQFDGIFRDSKVWINNCYLGGNFSGYTGSTYDITDFVHYGGKNTVVVRVDASQYEGWFYEGAGIYRHAWLNVYDPLHIAQEGGVFVHTVPAAGAGAAMNAAAGGAGGDGTGQRTGGPADVTIETTVDNNGLQDARATIVAYVTDRKGLRVAQGPAMPLAVGAGRDGIIKANLQLPQATWWSLDNPYLYRAVVLVRDGDHTIDSVCVRFGVRTIRIDKDKGLFLNGEPVKIHGVCCHQDHAGVGSALPDYLQYYRIGLLKEMGVNAYRTSHNAPTPELLDACDSLGMLVLDETRLLNSGPEYGTDFERQILRDRNHPSIFLWSIGNEEWVIQTSTTGKLVAQHQIQRQQQLDPTRTCTYAANVGNVFHGVNEVIPVRGFNYNLTGLDGYRRDHPDQPIMGTEVASTVSTRSIFERDTVNAYVPDYDSVAPPWASTAEYWWRIAAERPWFMGGFVWTGFDYRGEPTPYRWPDINSHFGVMDMCGFPKTVYYYYQSRWTDKDVLHIAPHWNWKGREGKPIPVWVNSNADDVELFLNGKSLGKKAMPVNGHLEWMVAYAPGKLTAIAHKHGRKLTAFVETTGAPYRIVATASKTSLTADGKDAVVVNCSVVDKQGREVPDAANLLRFAVSGPAKIIGVGNGNPSSHEPDQCPDGGWQRQLFGGKCQIIVQSITAPANAGGAAGAAPNGEVKLSISGDGLLPAEAAVTCRQG